jgi:thiosulfate dehydrogenase [quinone] large subunit
MQLETEPAANAERSAMIMTSRNYQQIPVEPEFVNRLFNTTRFAWLWAVLRIYVGYQWVDAGWHKVTGQGWTDGGSALKGFWAGAIKVPQTGKPPITYDWYRVFLQFLLNHGTYTWFGKVVAYSELFIGICLIIGLLTGFAAFGGALMNFNFMLAGSASTNPVLFFIAVLLILAWKAAGYLGVDRYLLPRIGTPWRAVATVPLKAAREG